MLVDPAVCVFLPQGKPAEDAAIGKIMLSFESPHICLYVFYL